MTTLHTRHASENAFHQPRSPRMILELVMPLRRQLGYEQRPADLRRRTRLEHERRLPAGRS
jgi:hypothetical protein